MSIRRRGWFAALLLCAVLAVVHTWPLAAAPGRHSRNDNGDTQLNEWILAWVAHQLPYAPARLFQANIFHPARDSLAFSEPLIVPALMGAPIRWLGGSPVLVFNIVLLLGFALTALATWRLVHAWTDDHAAGLLAGSLFAFNTHTLTRLPHIQGIHAWGLPLALLAADRVIVSGRFRDALWLAVWMTAMAYTSGYLVVFGAVMVGVLVIVRAADWWRQPARVLSRFAVAALVAGMAMLPVYLPYRRVAQEQGMVRTLDNVAGYSASLKGYLASAGRFHYSLWSEGFFREPIDSFFPGIAALAMTAAAVAGVLFVRRRDTALVATTLTRRRVWMLIAIAVAGLVLSLGPQTPLYGPLFHALPPVRGLRAAARFGNLFLLGIAAAAGIGLALVRARAGGRRATVLAVAIVAAANLEALRAPFLYTRFEGIPAIYSLLAEPRAPVVLVEVPFYPPHAIFENAAYVLNSTAHFRPLMNGYSGYVPETYRRLAEVFWHFPEPRAILAMRQAGATHVMVHPSRLMRHPDEVAEIMERVNASPYLERLAIGQHGMTLYRFR